MKKNIFTVLILQAFVAFYAIAESNFMEQKFYFTDEYGFVTIFENKLEFEDRVENGVFRRLNHFYFFQGTDQNYIVLNYRNDNEEFVTLVKKSVSKFQYDYWEMPYSKRLSKVYDSSKIVGFNVKKAGSFVVEKDSSNKEINFIPDDIFNVFSNPWAVSKDAKDKFICLKDERYCVPGSNYADIEEIIFINGFISPDKPHLYDQNSRAKNVRITYGDVSFVATLSDSGNYQSVKLPKKIKRKSNTTIKIEILDSYEGSKYSDIVISGILYIDALIN